MNNDTAPHPVNDTLIRLPPVGMDVVYNNLPDPLPPSVINLSFEANGVTQYGNYVRLDTTAFSDTSWACISGGYIILDTYGTRSLYPMYNATTNTTLNSLGWLWNVTITFYSVDAINATYATTDVLLFNYTQEFFIPWRPEHNASCSDPATWLGPDGNCYHGLGVLETYNFPGEGMCLPNITQTVVVGIVYSTQRGGFPPIQGEGPWDDLNLGSSLTAPSVGTNVVPGSAFYNASSDYNSPGPVNVYRIDYNWAPYTMALELFAVSAPRPISPTNVAVIWAPIVSVAGILLLIGIGIGVLMVFEQTPPRMQQAPPLGRRRLRY